jgi:superoxide dismutase, Fe-Mn family
MIITRREPIRKTALVAALGATGTLSPLLAQPAQEGPYQLTRLPYDYDALEPHIDARTMELHHSRHHQTYVTNVNKALANQPQLAQLPVEQLISDLAAIPENIRTIVRNHGGGHANHDLFWHIMSPKGGGQPRGELAQAIDRAFGNFSSFQDQFSALSSSVFGSGWAWLVLDRNNQLRLESTPNQDSPFMAGRVPLMGIDVWEHAYYLKYQNRRADYIKAFYNLIHWDYVADRYQRFRA